MVKLYLVLNKDKFDVYSDDAISVTVIDHQYCEYEESDEHDPRIYTMKPYPVDDMDDCDTLKVGV